MFIVINIELAVSEACARSLAALHAYKVYTLVTPEPKITLHELGRKLQRGKHVVLLDERPRADTHINTNKKTNG